MNSSKLIRVLGISFFLLSCLLLLFTPLAGSPLLTRGYSAEVRDLSDAEAANIRGSLCLMLEYRRMAVCDLSCCSLASLLAKDVVASNSGRSYGIELCSSLKPLCGTYWAYDPGRFCAGGISGSGVLAPPP